MNDLEKNIGYEFNNKELLERALTHSSYANDHQMKKIYCNERLEFLGDAVLEAASSEFLYEKYPNDMEGVLSKKRASLVCEEALAIKARDIKLGEYIKLGKSMLLSNGSDKDSILSDAFEAVIGAIFLDSGIEEAKKFIYSTVLSNVERDMLMRDSKTQFQEMVQKVTKDKIVYELVSSTGPDHDRVFEVLLKVGDKEFSTGTGKTKQAAGQMAARLSMEAAAEYFSI